MKNLRSRIAIIVTRLAALGIVCAMLFVYSQFVNEKVYEEAKHNFSEVYELHHQRTEGRSEGIDGCLQHRLQMA